ncbi:exosome RNA helicase MTR4-like isoform X1 [Procambarus clarkii]|uniref:exosome RNA helicase MTR4 n=1 Tax=Procambarus clarkii TaxID=6728 RepID=UPI001E677397|nr:exosome RNA helicase MTR4-like [Procambarus clarkii]
MACFGEDLFDFVEEEGVQRVEALPDIELVDEEENEKAAEELNQLLGKRIAEDDKKIKGVSKKRRSQVETTQSELRLIEDLPRIAVHIIETFEACTHEVAVPPGEMYIPLQPAKEKPAKLYSFILDPFQKEAILCIDNNQSVLVSAHTSAGKTVVAEYAVAMCLQNKQRVIYTTPIKALSNQKYRDFSDEFTDVGLLTGDVTINPNASCLIMTTEILRSMLYRGSEVTREAGWVIFDEIHYMRDKERGYVWEETIILLPPTVKFVFLSATIPNASQFAQWVCYLHHQPCHVVYTDYRPTPLQHYIFPAGGEGIYLSVDETGKFREDNFNTAMTILQNAPEQAHLKGKKGGVKDGSDCYKLVKMIMERNFAPVIIFSFSKKECEAYALQVSKLDFNLAEEKQLVDEVFSNAISVLSEEDRQLPQVVSVLPLLRRGIGIHHGGLLPIIKETIEILFGEGLVKALFATETFAMGLNMPARTVLFTNVRKFDGQDFRWLTSGEYIQMSGRAGRRGKDDKGVVIMMVDEKLNTSVVKNLVQGNADPINSAFHLTYNMVLNLLRVEQINPEYILERSFFQFQNYSSIPALCDRVRTCETELETMNVPRETEVESYYKIKQTIHNLKNERHAFITRPIYIMPFLQPGRLVYIKNNDDDFGWGVVLSYKKQEDKKNPMEAPTITVDVILRVSEATAASKVTSDLKPPKPGEKSEPVVMSVMLKLIQEVSAVRLKLPSDLKPLDQRVMVMKMVQEALKRVPENQFLLDPVKNMKIKDETLLEIVNKLEKFSVRLESHRLHKEPDRDELYEKFSKKMEMKKELNNAEVDLKRAKSLLQMDELKCRKRVLRRLGYATSQDVIERKGRVACELSAADELLITEMLFNGLFNNITAAQTCALLSTFVCDEKSSEMPKLGEELSGPLRQMQDMARRIARVSHECKLEIDEENYVEQFRPFLMDVVYDWCNGSSFMELCTKTEIYEGSIIRAMRRLEELLRQMIQAAKAIGIDLENKFSEGVKLLKRDIVFAASLYL